jgi:hypothetical protein
MAIEREKGGKRESSDLTPERQIRIVVQCNCIFNRNISIQFFIIYVPSQQLQGQLQTQHSAEVPKYIMDRLNI